MSDVDERSLSGASFGSRGEPRASTWAARLGLLWGILGVLATLVEALVRLAPYAVEPLRTGMSPLAAGAYAGFVAFNAYAEGYRGFQRAFSPRLAVRARLLRLKPSRLRVLLAPLFLMGLVEATRKRLLLNWSLVLAIVGLVFAVRTLAQPWRGVVDAGVFVGLLWGLCSTVLCLIAVLRGRSFEVDAELPAAAPASAVLAAVPQRGT